MPSMRSVALCQSVVDGFAVFHACIRVAASTSSFSSTDDGLAWSVSPSGWVSDQATQTRSTNGLADS